MVLLAAILAGAVVLRLWVGKDAPNPEAAAEFMRLRWMKVGAGVSVGVALGVAGVFLQAMMRNPLASPDILGLASGSGLGIMLAAWVAYRAGAGLSASDSVGIGNGAAAVVGSLGALGVVWLLSQRRGVLEPVTLVLVGVAVSIMCSAGTMLVRHLMPDQGMSAGRLLMGTVRDVTARELAAVGPLSIAGVVVGVLCGRAMDAASLGEDESRSVGVGLGKLRTVLFVTAGVLTAGSVLLAGPIGFVGLICPHVVRMLAGPRHGALVVGSALAGAAMVVVCDAIARTIDLGGGQLPIGVITSMVGGPVLIGLLRAGRRAG